MGTSNTKLDQIQKLNLDQWETIQSKPDFDVMRHRVLKNEAEVRNVIINNKKDDDSQLAIYHFRKTSTAPIVKALAVKKMESKSKEFCSNQKMMKVFTQRIIKRFNQFPQLTFPESVYCLREALQGYRVLSKKAGPFQVTDKMMGINTEGQFKVWTNQNLGMNHPEHERSVLDTTHDDTLDYIGTEKEMITQIFSVIQDKNQQGKFPEQFQKRILKASNSFEKCESQLDDFIYEKKLSIPKNIHPNLGYVLQKTIQYVQANTYRKTNEIPISNIVEKKPQENFLTNTQRITTQAPETRYQYTQSYTYNPQVHFSTGQNISTPSPKKIETIPANPHIIAAQSVYQRRTQEFNSPENKVTGAIPVADNRVTVTSHFNEKISQSNVARVVPGQALAFRTYSQPPPPQKIVYNAPVAKIKFNYGQNRVENVVSGYQPERMYQTKIISGDRVEKKEEQEKKQQQFVLQEQKKE